MAEGLALDPPDPCWPKPFRACRRGGWLGLGPGLQSGQQRARSSGKMWPEES